MSTRSKRVKVHIWIDGELVSISDFEFTKALVEVFVKNVGKFFKCRLGE
jgi:hypothetical protein